MSTGNRSLGIELEPHLVESSNALVTHYNVDNVRFHCGNAAEVPEISSANVFYMYLPCKGPVLDGVLEVLRKVAETKPITIWWRGFHCDWPKGADWLEWKHIPKDPIAEIAVAKSLIHP